MEKMHFIDALELSLSEKNKSICYFSDEKREGYLYFSTQLEKVMFMYYGIPCAFTEEEAKDYIAEQRMFVKSR
jgi:hypothetical protein